MLVGRPRPASTPSGRVCAHFSPRAGDATKPVPHRHELLDPHGSTAHRHEPALTSFRPAVARARAANPRPGLTLTSLPYISRQIWMEWAPPARRACVRRPPISPRPQPTIGAMIDRDQVLHVAKLARLAAHRRRGRAHGRGALEDPRARRADRRARPRGRRADLARGRARERAARRRAAPEPAARAGARAGARTRPTAASASRARAPRERRAARASPPRRRPSASRRASSRLGRAVRVLARARGRRRASAPTCGWPTRRRRGRRAPLGGVPVAVKDLFCTEGVPSDGGLADPRGLPAAVHRHGGRAASQRGRRAACSARRTWTSSRWARRTRTPATARS